MTKLTELKELSRKKLANGSVVRVVQLRKLDGTASKPVIRFVKPSSRSEKTATTKNLKKVRAAKTAPITAAQAQAAFNRFYGRTIKHRRGVVKPLTPIFKSVRGRLAAKTYDLGHTQPSSRVISDRRYLTPLGPRSYDFTGVDTGSKVRVALTANQKASLAAARAKLAAARAKLGKKTVKPSVVKRASPKPRVAKCASPKPRVVKCASPRVVKCALPKRQTAGMGTQQVAGYWW
jgi:hypothetical protein